MITVFNYMADLFDVADEVYIAVLDRVSDDISRHQPYPFNMFVQSSIQNAALPLASDLSRNEKLRRLMGSDLTYIGEDCLRT